MTNIGVFQLHILPCASYIYCRVPVYCVYVLVIVDFLLFSFKLILGCLFSPHHVNQGGVQKTTPQVTLYKPDTTKERKSWQAQSGTVWSCGPTVGTPVGTVSKSWYQAFFWVLIDLIIGFLTLIIKAFDNQTEIWDWLSSPLIIKLFAHQVSQDAWW